MNILNYFFSNIFLNQNDIIVFFERRIFLTIIFDKRVKGLRAPWRPPETGILRYLTVENETYENIRSKQESENLIITNWILNFLWNSQNFSVSIHNFLFKTSSSLYSSRCQFLPSIHLYMIFSSLSRTLK